MASGSHSLRQRSFSQWLLIFFSGICMGAADIVPGISGGTVAFILGIYPELIESLKSFNGEAFQLLAGFRFAEFFRSVQWKFLSALVGGAAVSFLTLAHAISFILSHEDYRVYLYSIFLGLILGSVWFCAKQLSCWKLTHLSGLLLGAVAAYALTGANIHQKSEEPLYNVSIVLGSPSQQVENYADGKLLNVTENMLSAMLSKGVIGADTMVASVDNAASGPAIEFINHSYTMGLDLWTVCCGAIAISAMLLPGISGSYLLTILGMYSLVIGALADFINGLRNGVFEGEAFFVLSSMMTGIIIGAIVFSRLVSWMFQYYRNGTIAVLTGFMLGALSTVWPFWSYTYYYLPLKLEIGPQLQPLAPIIPDLQSPLFFNALVFTLAGFLLVFTLELYAKKMNN